MALGKGRLLNVPRRTNDGRDVSSWPGVRPIRLTPDTGQGDPVPPVAGGTTIGLSFTAISTRFAGRELQGNRIVGYCVGARPGRISERDQLSDRPGRCHEVVLIAEGGDLVPAQDSLSPSSPHAAANQFSEGVFRDEIEVAGRARRSHHALASGQSKHPSHRGRRVALL